MRLEEQVRLWRERGVARQKELDAVATEYTSSAVAGMTGPAVEGSDGTAHDCKWRQAGKQGAIVDRAALRKAPVCRKCDGGVCHHGVKVCLCLLLGN